MSGEVNVVVR